MLREAVSSQQSAVSSQQPVLISPDESRDKLREIRIRSQDWNLDLGIYLEFGSWVLEF
jgi:hypothetical protein